MVRALLIVGVSKSDLYDSEAVEPMIAGAVNEAVWENDPESADREIARIKGMFDISGDYMEWREVWASFAATPLAGLFAVPMVEGALET